MRLRQAAPRGAQRPCTREASCGRATRGDLGLAEGEGRAGGEGRGRGNEGSEGNRAHCERWNVWASAFECFMRKDVIKHFYACPPRKTPHIRAKRKQKKAPMSTAARGRACAPPGAAVRRLLLLLLLLGVVDVGSTAGREGVAAVGDGAAADGDGAELLAYARERAALCAGAQCAGAVVVGFANMGYSKFALNWVLSMRLIGLDNFVLVALDQRAHAYFSRLGVPSFYLASLGAGAEGSLHHNSGKFRDIMHIRLDCALVLLRGGLDVWLTDVDAVFNSDPFPYVSEAALGTNSAALAYDTPFLPSGKNSPLMVCCRRAHASMRLHVQQCATSRRARAPALAHMHR